MSTLTVTGQLATSRTAAVAAGLVGAISTAAYMSSVIFLPDLDGKDGAVHPLTQTSACLTALSFVVLAVTLPALPSLPRWALSISAAGCAFVATTAWTFGPFMAHVSGLLTEAQADQFQNVSSGFLTLFWLPKMILCGAGFLTLAVTGWRRRAIARPACVVLTLAGVVSGLLPGYPPGAFLSALALAWAARTAVQRP